MLQIVAGHPASFVTNAEVLQELLHRYLSLRLWGQGSTVVTEFARLMRDRAEPITADDVVAAASLADSLSGLSARDLLHVAVMQRIGASQIATADRAFDRVPSLQRLDPAAVDAWGGQISE